ncbi:hypothetical protein ASG49_04360 [Marmoricola sp. Leaf446]|uniref:hypothetical protein n=1 Tax=Marmoricola sp. Leaf446 TaxID=1736379 RepID=UPI0006FAF227|nr:hypothetical protein [Marmoricola sp. Leaf446]KQT94150.1 hypothetical protein ASG49_04360 [Marmoricola sp. Leaf446]
MTPRPPDPDHLRAELDRLVVSGQQDLQRLWELLMAPLGFATRSLWVTFLDPDGRPLPQLLEIGELPDEAPDEGVQGLFELLTHALGEGLDGLGVAFLVVRPGRAGLVDDDRRLARALLTGARGAGIRCHPVHVADDVRLLPVTPDDLAA